MPFSTLANPLAHAVKNAWATFLLLSSFTLHCILLIVVGTSCLHLYASFYLQPFGSVSTMDLLACPEAYPVQAWSMEALHWCQEGTQELVHHRCKAHVLDLMDILESLKWNFCKFKSRLFALSYHGSTPIQLWYQVNEKQKILNIIQRVIFLPAIISKSIFFPAIISENHKWIQRIEIENQNPAARFHFLV